MKIEINETVIEYWIRYGNWLKLQHGVAKDGSLKGLIKRNIEINKERIKVLKNELKTKQNENGRNKPNGNTSTNNVHNNNL